MWSLSITEYIGGPKVYNYTNIQVETLSIKRIQIEAKRVLRLKNVVVKAALTEGMVYLYSSSDKLLGTATFNLVVS